jgi:hypothetical protein
MPRSSRAQAIGPDSHYQLPHPDLVTDPPSLLERTRFDLLRFQHLWEQLGLQARTLLVEVAELQAAGGCPPDLARAIQRAAATCLPPDVHNLEEGEGEGGVGGVTDEDDVHLYHDHGVNIILMGEYEGVGDNEEERLARILRGLKVANPILVIRQYGPRIVSEALENLFARPSGEVANPGAYLRAMLRNSKPRPAPMPVEIRYTRGKYGHVVNT